MDILAPYNVERLLLLSSNYNFKFVKEIMDNYEQDPKLGVNVPDSVYNTMKTIITGNSGDFLVISPGNDSEKFI